jgi:hypothetical protein
MPGRALRITGIPTSITKDQLRECLEALNNVSGQQEPNVRSIRSLTLVPDGRTQVSTVAFYREPQIFSKVSPRHPVDDVELNFGGVQYEVTVDCDFLGVTALYSSGDEALVEYNSPQF